MAKSNRSLPAALREGLEPIKVSLMLGADEYEQESKRLIGKRRAEVHRKLELLLKVYAIEHGPDSWYQLCAALAQERFPGFREKAGRKPTKWTPGALWVLAGDMCREVDAGCAQSVAVDQLAAREPWKTFLSSGKRGAAEDGRKGGAPLLVQYTHMPAKYRSVGEALYRMHATNGTLDEWDRRVREMLEP